MKYFTVGPSQLHPRYREFMDAAIEEDIGSLSHRSQKFHEIFRTLTSDLKQLLAIPSDYAVAYTGSATEFMERIVQNTSKTNTLNFVNGAFSKKFAEIAKGNGRAVTIITPRLDQSFALEDVPADTTPELVCLTHNETSNGTTLPRAFISSVRKRFPDAIIALDIVSSAPVGDIDPSEVDCIFFSVQKAFGLPAGLGALFISPRAVARAQAIASEGAHYTGSFHSFVSLIKESSADQTPETPNVLNMYLLGKVVRDYLERGVAQMRAETIEKAKMLYEAVSAHPELRLAVENVAIRSSTVIVAETPGGSKAIIDQIKQKGFQLGTGYGELKDQQVRIGNFPSHTKEDVRALVRALAGES